MEPNLYLNQCSADPGYWYFDMVLNWKKILCAWIARLGLGGWDSFPAGMDGMGGAGGYASMCYIHVNRVWGMRYGYGYGCGYRHAGEGR